MIELKLEDNFSNFDKKKKRRYFKKTKQKYNQKNIKTVSINIF